jgi:hypothetical protein
MILTRPRTVDTQANWDPSWPPPIPVTALEYFLAAKKTVVVIPHGPLSALPFEALVDSKAHAEKRFWSATDRPSYLLEKYAFSYAPSFSVLANLRARKSDRDPGWSMVAFGDAVYQDEEKKRESNPGADRLMSSLSGNSPGSRGPELKPLPGARKEISEIVKSWGAHTDVSGPGTNALQKGGPKPLQIHPPGYPRLAPQWGGKAATAAGNNFLAFR